MNVEIGTEAAQFLEKEYINVIFLAVYFQDRSAYSAAGKYVDRSWEYINRSQIYECGNWN
jgi:hypothetical protein